MGRWMQDRTPPGMEEDRKEYERGPSPEGGIWRSTLPTPT